MARLDKTWFIQYLGQLLNDENKRFYQQAFLENIWKEALSELAIVRSDLFAGDFEMRIEGLGPHRLDAAYTELRSVWSIRPGGQQGCAPRLRELEQMADEKPCWQQESADDCSSDEQPYIIFDRKNPDVFWISPPAPKNTTVHISALKAIDTDSIVLDERFIGPVINYGLFRAGRREGIISTADTFDWQRYIESLKLHLQAEDRHG